MALKPYISEHGISYLTSPLHTPEHNGLAERKHRHIVETGLMMLRQPRCRRCIGHSPLLQQFIESTGCQHQFSNYSLLLKNCSAPKPILIDSESLAALATLGLDPITDTSWMIDPNSVFFWVILLRRALITVLIRLMFTSTHLDTSNLMRRHTDSSSLTIPLLTPSPPPPLCLDLYLHPQVPSTTLTPNSQVLPFISTSPSSSSPLTLNPLLQMKINRNQQLS